MFDLHLHSHFSDGTWSPTNLVEHAISLGLSHLALTDHDTIDGIAEARAAATDKLTVIDGIEINTIWQDRANANKAHDVHILGYCFDAQAPSLVSIIKRQREARERQIKETLKNIRASGIYLDYEQIPALCRQYPTKGVIGKPQLTEALVRIGAASNLTEAYEKYTARSSPCFVERQSVSPFEAVEAIKSAGGSASIAHPNNGAHIIPLIKELAACGLGAIEAYHRMHDEEVVVLHLELAAQLGLLVTGGSDCHGPFKDETTGEYFPSTMGMVRDKKLPEELLVSFLHYCKALSN